MSGYFRALVLCLCLASASGCLAVFVRFENITGPARFGATFSSDYASYLGLDPHETFLALMNDLGLKAFRLPVHWNAIEGSQSAYDFSDLDWYMDEAARHGAHVTLAIGNKVPRWPECFTPDWAMSLSKADYDLALTAYTKAIVERYRTSPALERWQVENEPLFRFGYCPRFDNALFTRELAEVRATDPDHPIELTVSGEQQWWASLAKPADVIGTSLYRTVALPDYETKISFPIPPVWYSLQALSVSFVVPQVAISELQVEPWLPRDYRSYSPDEAAALFTPHDLDANLRYARKTGLKDISFWGVEWWYYLAQHGHPELWQAAQNLLKTQN